MAYPNIARRRHPAGGTERATPRRINAVVLAIAAAFAMSWGAVSAMSKTPAQKTAPAARFATLDAYLAHLAKGGTMDRPYYHLLPDGRYQLIAGRGSNRNPQFFTRDELLKKFGFER